MIIIKQFKVYPKLTLQGQLSLFILVTVEWV